MGISDTYLFYYKSTQAVSNKYYRPKFLLIAILDFSSLYLVTGRHQNTVLCALTAFSAAKKFWEYSRIDALDGFLSNAES